ncbi:hypothetical protein E3N88_40111 [Mikania micrantha]|uniref:Uncharacterized protein n=1 Tax=Mikania micrantha TaxID=192012 RepID=A0A5N6LLU8_9ASTR|nr:hypothetical protein E3N88_40111 [Mikania micrantha]
MEHTQFSMNFITKLPVVMAAIKERKKELSSMKLHLLMQLETDVMELENRLRVLNSEIDLLEHTASVMRMHLVKRGLLVVESADHEQD